MASKVPAEQGHIPDIEALTGKARAEAMYRKAFDAELFDRNPESAFEEGTRENPIPILSAQSERVVGVSLPVSERWGTGRGTRPRAVWKPVHSPRHATLNNPALVHSQDDAEIRWFTLRKGELAYDPDTCNFFALKQVTQEQVDEWIKFAEEKVAKQ